MESINAGSMVNSINTSYENYSNKSRSVLSGVAQTSQPDVNVGDRLSNENRSAAASAANMTDDDAKALSGMASDRIKMNVGMAMLAQANKIPSDVLKLLK
jgi:mannose/fructose/N-acetylgalactosamine-specific phosphotransferase system component IIB